MSFSELFPIEPTSLPTIRTSVMLRRLMDNVPEEHFTLEWVVSSMPNRSYGVVILFLGLISFIPVIGNFSRLLVMLFAFQIMLGRKSPVLPRRIRLRKLSSHHLKHLPPFAFKMLMAIEKSVRPRWSTLLSIRPLSGCVLFLVCFCSLIVPLPFANIPAAAVICLMSLAYLEHDGLLLAIAEIVGLSMCAFIILGFYGFSNL